MDTQARSPSPLAARIAAAFPALAKAPPATLDRLAAKSLHRRVPAGTVMFNERTPCTGFPLVLGGAVRVVQQYPNGRELQLYRVKPGESCLVSGSCLLGETAYPASGFAESEVELLIVPPAEFRSLVAEDEAFRAEAAKLPAVAAGTVATAAVASDVATWQDAAGGCDGVKTGSCGFHTASNETDPWWQVDLGKPCLLDRVVVFNRTDGTAAARTRNLRVLVADRTDQPEFVEVYRHNGETFYGVREGRPPVPLLEVN